MYSLFYLRIVTKQVYIYIIQFRKNFVPRTDLVGGSLLIQLNDRNLHAKNKTID